MKRIGVGILLFVAVAVMLFNIIGNKNPVNESDMTSTYVYQVDCQTIGMMGEMLWDSKLDGQSAGKVSVDHLRSIAASCGYPHKTATPETPTVTPTFSLDCKDELAAYIASQGKTIPGATAISRLSKCMLPFIEATLTATAQHK